MKKNGIVIFIMVLAVMLTGCNSSMSGILGNGSAGNRKSISVFYPRIPQYIPEKETISDWEDYMRNKYDINIDLEYVRKTNSGSINFSKLLDESEAEGLVIINDYADLTELIEADMLMPVDFYMETIRNFKNMNMERVEAFVDSYGNLWGIPLLKGSPHIDKRTYNKEWLDSYKAGVPDTIERFWDLAEYIANNDPDGNGVHDTYIMEYTDRFFFRDFSDILKAFGCYTRYSNPVAYNPQRMQFENCILSDNFIEAMEFIKWLEAKGYVINSNSAKKEYKVASSMISLNKSYVNDRTYGYYLKGPNERMLIEERYAGYCVSLLKHTDSPAEKLDNFFGIVYGSPDSYMDFQFGIEGKDYFDLIDHYEVNFNLNDLDDSPQIGIYTSLNHAEFNVKPIINTAGDLSIAEMTRRIDASVKAQDVTEVLQEYSGTDMVYSISFDTYDYVTRNIVQVSGLEKLISDIMTHDVPIEDAVDEYRELMEIYGYLDELAEMNNH